MIKQTPGKKTGTKAGTTRKAVHKNTKAGSVSQLLPPGSPERATAGIVAAAGGALLAAATLGVGPVALAGAAGYVAYRESRRNEKARNEKAKDAVSASPKGSGR